MVPPFQMSAPKGLPTTLNMRTWASMAGVCLPTLGLSSLGAPSKVGFGGKHPLPSGPRTLQLLFPLKPTHVRRLCLCPCVPRELERLTLPRGARSNPVCLPILVKQLWHHQLTSKSASLLIRDAMRTLLRHTEPLPPERELVQGGPPTERNASIPQ